MNMWGKTAEAAKKMSTAEIQLNLANYDNRNNYYMLFDLGHDMTKIGVFTKDIAESKPTEYVMIPT